jgi:single-stranded DNA-binding protein
MDYQKFILFGNASTDAKSQKSKKGDVSFTTFGVGVKNNNDRTSFFRVVVFGKLGESLVSYITKGRQVLVEGHIEVSEMVHFNVISERVVLGALPKETKPVEKTEKAK